MTLNEPVKERASILSRTYPGAGMAVTVCEVVQADQPGAGLVVPVA